MASPIEIAREFLPNEDEKTLELVIWSLTGFPGFWPDKNITPEENFRKQLAFVRERVDSGVSIFQQVEEYEKHISDELQKIKDIKEEEKYLEILDYPSTVKVVS